MNLTKFFRKNSKWLIVITIGAFALTTVTSLVLSYASLFFK
jgi:hypothetical protein